MLLGDVGEQELRQVTNPGTCVFPLRTSNFCVCTPKMSIKTGYTTQEAKSDKHLATYTSLLTLTSTHVCLQTYAYSGEYEDLFAWSERIYSHSRYKAVHEGKRALSLTCQPNVHLLKTAMTNTENVQTQD